MNTQDEKHPGNNLYPDGTPPVQPPTYYPFFVEPNTNSSHTSVPTTAPDYEGYVGYERDNPLNYDNTPPVLRSAHNRLPRSESCTSLTKLEPNYEAPPPPTSSESSYLPTYLTRQEPNFKNPPPSYCIGIEADRELESFKPVVSQQPTSHVPQILYCDCCKESSESIVKYNTSFSTYFASGICCVLGCWPCCLIPFFYSSCQRAEHSCPTCRRGLGAHEPFYIAV